MNIALNVEATKTGRFYTLSTDKAAMTVYVSDLAGYVQACVGHRIGTGKVFHGANALCAAIAAYKSSACKAMLEAVQHEENARKAVAS